MLAKLVVEGATRAEAIDRAIWALKRLALLGVTTNIDYLIRVLDSAGFRAGALHTGFLTQEAGALAPVPSAETARDAALIAAALGLREIRQVIEDVPELYAAIGHWRN